MLMTKEKLGIKNFTACIESFQREANELTQSDKLPFTLCIWTCNEKYNANLNAKKHFKRKENNTSNKRVSILRHENCLKRI